MVGMVILKSGTQAPLILLLCQSYLTTLWPKIVAIMSSVQAKGGKEKEGQKRADLLH